MPCWLNPTRRTRARGSRQRPHGSASQSREQGRKGGLDPEGRTGPQHGRRALLSSPPRIWDWTRERESFARLPSKPPLPTYPAGSGAAGSRWGSAPPPAGRKLEHGPHCMERSPKPDLNCVRDRQLTIPFYSVLGRNQHSRASLLGRPGRSPELTPSTQSSVPGAPARRPPDAGGERWAVPSPAGCPHLWNVSSGPLLGRAASAPSPSGGSPSALLLAVLASPPPQTPALRAHRLRPPSHPFSEKAWLD